MTLVDSGTGNLFSLTEAFRRAGARVDVARDPGAVRRAECIVLPGVASFSAVAEGIEVVRGALIEAMDDRVPLLGICAGMQVLFESSEEGPGLGLGRLPGRVQRLAADVVPHMGWNRVEVLGDPWLRGLPADPMLYFAHSYAAPADAPDVVGIADHGGPFAAAVRSGNVFGVQFHPEKSGRIGAAVLRKFLSEAGVGPSA